MKLRAHLLRGVVRLATGILVALGVVDLKRCEEGVVEAHVDTNN